jgi:excisionase family DNA binding protein
VSAELLTLSEASRRLRVSDKTLRAIIKRQELKAARVGAQWRFKSAWLDEYEGHVAEAEATANGTLASLPTCGVYLLFLGGDVVYVGRSTSMRSRLADHRRSGRRFDAHQTIACDEPTSVWLEKELIRTLGPIQNILRYQRAAKAAQHHLAERGLS